MDDYDERAMSGFARVEQTNRKRLIKITVAAGIILTVVSAGLFIARIEIDPTSSRGIGIIGVLVWFAILTIAPVFALPYPRHRIVHHGRLEFPQLGGIRRGVLPLTRVGWYRVHETKSTTAYVELKLRVGSMIIEFSELADPPRFIEALKSAGVSEQLTA